MEFAGEKIIRIDKGPESTVIETETYVLEIKEDGSLPPYYLTVDRGEDAARLFFEFDREKKLAKVYSDGSHGVKIDVKTRKIDGETHISPTQKHVILTTLEPEFKRGEELAKELEKFLEK